MGLERLKAILRASALAGCIRVMNFLFLHFTFSIATLCRQEIRLELFREGVCSGVVPLRKAGMFDMCTRLM